MNWAGGDEDVNLFMGGVSGSFNTSIDVAFTGPR